MSAEETPVRWIVRGDPDDVETAALAAVLLALAAPRRGKPAATAEVWAGTARQARPPVHSGPGGWPASGLPA